LNAIESLEQNDGVVVNAVESYDQFDAAVPLQIEQEEVQLHANANDHNNQHVGMVLLLESLDVDPGLENFLGNFNRDQWASKYNADGVRLFANHFAPLDHTEGIQIPSSWNDFFTISLLNPNRFD
jgi:hypothetical protein